MDRADRGDRESFEIRGWAGAGSWDPPPDEPPPPPKAPQKKDDDGGRKKERSPDDDGVTSRRSGLVMGRFLPPHLGHQHLIDFARASVKHLTVMVVSREADPIPGALRTEWMREMFPGVNVLHARVESSDEPAVGGDDFARRWVEIIRKHVPEGPSFFFASDARDTRVAEQLGARYVPVDPERRSVPISGTILRKDPLKSWAFLPPVVRPHYLQHVHVLGAESTGKSTLAQRLAERFGTFHVAEYARTLAEDRGTLLEGDLTLCARGQVASTRALSRYANRVLINDTSLLSVRLWGERLFGAAPSWIDDELASHRPHLALVTSPDAPFVGLSSRDDPAARKAFHRRHLDELTRSNTPHLQLTGAWDHQFVQAVEAIERLIANAR